MYIYIHTVTCTYVDRYLHMYLLLYMNNNFCPSEGAYCLGAYNLGPPILNLGNHSLTGGLQSGGLQSRATDFGPGQPLTDWRPTVWGPTISGYRFWTWGTTH